MHTRKRRTNWLGIVLGLMVTLLFAGLSGIAAFEYLQIKTLKESASQAQTETGSAKTSVFELNKQVANLRTMLAVAQQETPQQTQTRLLKEVSELFDTPKGETPTLAQIIDKSKLTGQPFLKDAENGDYIIMYSKAKVSIVYRPSDQKIINSGPIEISE